MSISSHNSCWQECPDRPGEWWAVDPDVQHVWQMARVIKRDGKLVLRLEGEEMAVEDRPPGLHWLRACPPVYFWPSGDFDP